VCCGCVFLSSSTSSLSLLSLRHHRSMNVCDLFHFPSVAHFHSSSSFHFTFVVFIRLTTTKHKFISFLIFQLSSVMCTSHNNATYSSPETHRVPLRWDDDRSIRCWFPVEDVHEPHNRPLKRSISLTVTGSSFGSLRCTPGRSNGF
jgi:hypothetical protein